MANARDQARAGTVTIATVRSREEAFRLVGQLDTAGIECALLEERLTVPAGEEGYPSGGIKVQVDRSDAKRAIELLRARHYDMNAAVDKQTAPRRRRRHRHSRGWARTALEVGLLLGAATLLAALFFMV